MDAETTSRAPDDLWPGDGLERVATCPACGSEARAPLLSDLKDVTFFAAPGRWSLWSCKACASAFLDPRPTPESIGLAYRNYYTHAAAQEQTSELTLSALGRLRVMISNDYRNRRYGLDCQPSIPGGYLLGRLSPKLSMLIDERFRYLPKPDSRSRERRMLDVGCGAGEFIRRAQALGWTVDGLDFDPEAVDEARKSGADVQVGGVDALKGRVGIYDAVTLNHVVEHLHDPARDITTIRDAMRPGATLYIQTPNIASQGFRNYREHWRGLEVPRHLVIFNPASLRALLERCGFKGVKLRHSPPNYATLNELSRKIRDGRDPYSPEPVRPGDESAAEMAASDADPRRSEFITMTCVRPS